MLKWPTVAEAWTYRDPQEIADALINRSAHLDRRPGPPAIAPSAPCTNRDRYYRQARQLCVRQAMKGSR